MQRTKLEKGSVILNALLLMLGAFLYFADLKPVYGAILMIAGFFTLFSWVRERYTIYKYKVITAIFNILVTISIAIDCFLSEKKYLPYVWIFAAVMLLVALYIQHRRYLSGPPETELNKSEYIKR